MAKQSKRKTETAPLKWQDAQNLLKLLKVDGRHEERLLFALGFYTGLRISDILRLTWGQITGLRAFDVVEKKTGKIREIKVNDDLAAIIREARAALLREGEALEDAAPVFTSKRGRAIGKRLTVVGANIRIREALERYGIKTQNPSSHTLRKTFARRVYDNNGQTENALIILSQILNHSGPAMTRKYIGITRERIANIYLSL